MRGGEGRGRGVKIPISHARNEIMHELCEGGPVVLHGHVPQPLLVELNCRLHPLS